MYNSPSPCSANSKPQTRSTFHLCVLHWRSLFYNIHFQKIRVYTNEASVYSGTRLGRMLGRAHVLHSKDPQGPSPLLGNTSFSS